MEKIICWWSGGITSAVACKLAIDSFGVENCRVIMLDTGNEHPDTYRFKKDCEIWYKTNIELLKSTKYENIQETWYRHLSLNTAKGAICSYMLKRRVREEWEKTNTFSHQVFGFEYDRKELKRAKALKYNHSHTKPIFPLIKARKNKQDCINYVLSEGLVIPKAYSLGFNNNNCLGTGCVQGGIGYWKKIQKEMPTVFNNMAKVEHELTNLKGKPITMLKDQSNKAKKAGIQLVFLKKHPNYPQHKCLDDMKGREIKPLTDCNGLCGIDDLVERNITENEINFEELPISASWQDL